MRAQGTHCRPRLPQDEQTWEGGRTRSGTIPAAMPADRLLRQEAVGTVWVIARDLADSVDNVDGSEILPQAYIHAGFSAIA